MGEGCGSRAGWLGRVGRRWLFFGAGAGVLKPN